jgi:signal transduction histidine kinase
MDTDEILRNALLIVAALSGLALVVRRPREPLGPLTLAASAVGTIGAFVADTGPAVAGLLPAVVFHLALGLPDGRLGSTGRHVSAVIGWAIGMATAVGLTAAGPRIIVWPVVIEAAVGAVAASAAFASRIGRVGQADQRRMKWMAWAVGVAAGATLAAAGLHALVSWPEDLLAVGLGAAVLIPLGLLAGTSRSLGAAIDPLLLRTISLAGLTLVVVAVYLVVVLGLGRVPRRDERTLLVLSMVAAGVAVVLYFPAHRRLSALAKRVVYRERHAPDEAIRTFGSRMSRSIPLDELLLQMAESMRKTFSLTSAEVWTLVGDALHLQVADPERSRSPIPIAATELDTVARAGASGNAWARIWLPAVLLGREEALVRLAPIVHSGELLGLIVAERPPEANAFSADEDRTVVELARQVGLTLHNVRLDSALQASLDEVRRQAQELQASRGRIVAAADAARRGIERNLHDGAQQHLVALAVKVGLAGRLLERDPERAKAILDELGADVQDTIQQLRDLAHGIYPPLLADKGLPDALAAAARRSPLPTTVETDGIGRYPQEKEAAVYFCVLEALQNAGKYAGSGAKATIHVREEVGGLLFDVHDDGAGFDVARKGVGAGFVNMNDRLGAVRGNLRVESTLGKGTRVTGVIPLDPPAGSR